jgi:hypothetical protein
MNEERKKSQPDVVSLWKKGNRVLTSESSEKIRIMLHQSEPAGGDAGGVSVSPTQAMTNSGRVRLVSRLAFWASDPPTARIRD